MSLFLIFWMGWLVSFMGQLPLGILSITATQIVVSENFSNGWKYVFGVMIAEAVYVRLTASGVAWIAQHNLFFEILSWIMVMVFLFLGVTTFISAIRQKEEKKPVLLNNKLNRFLLGALMSALNPGQISFWFIWSSYLVEIHALPAGFAAFNFFTAGAALGTISGLSLYMYGGNWLIKKMRANNKILNIIMGGIFIIAALIQLYRIFHPQL